MSVVFVAASQLPTPFAVFTMHGFLDEESGKEHVALTLGDVADGQPVLGRLHSECLTGDALFSQRCDCGSQLEAALQAGLGGAFPAAQYFRVLPAHGPLPKAAIDPVNGIDAQVDGLQFSVPATVTASATQGQSILFQPFSAAADEIQPLVHFFRRHLVEVLEELLPVRTNRAVGREHLVVTAGGLRIDCG